MLFIDTSNTKEIEKYISLGICNGITTNQKILQNCNIKQTIQDILVVSEGYPINIELTKTSGTDDDLIAEATEYANQSKQIVIKIPMWGNGRGLRIAQRLQEIDIKTNITCCMSAEQVLLASLSGATYVSLFFRRIVDYQFSRLASHPESYQAACKIVSASSDLLSLYGSSTELIIGSIREPSDVTTCLLHGAGIITVPPKILEKMFQHPKTDETILEFDKAWTDLITQKTQEA